jgi:ubiquinol-cytochrome c reductase cytochrome c subunit
MKLVACIALALALAPAASAAGNPQQGKSLYGRYCLKCHGANGMGRAVAPSLRGVGARAADFYLRTGYMPLQKLGLQPRRSTLRLSGAEIADLIAYVASLGHGPPVPAPQPAKGNVAQGLHLFTDHCAGCHQVVAEGGYVTGAVPPSLEDDSAVQIAEAVRIGPNVMPTFTPKAISNHDLDSIIAYVEYAKHPDDRGGWALGHLGPIPEGLVTWFLAAAALVALCTLVGKRLSSE